VSAFTGWVEPVLFTTARAYASDKSLATFGLAMESFAYAQDYPAVTRGAGTHPGEVPAKCVICSVVSGVIVIDVDDPELFATTALGKFLNGAKTVVRGDHYHVYVDARALGLLGLWVKGAKIPGADIKGAGHGGFVMAAGTVHPSGDTYTWLENSTLVIWSEELGAALIADGCEIVPVAPSIPAQPTGEQLAREQAALDAIPGHVNLIDAVTEEDFAEGRRVLHAARPWLYGDPDGGEPDPWEAAYAAFTRDFQDDRCESFQPGGYQHEEGHPHWDYHCGAPHCPYPPQRIDRPFNVPDHSLGHRDELLSHIQRCADAGWSYEELTVEADRVQVALRPGDPWDFTNGNLGGMIKGALEKAPRHQAENRARADAELATVPCTPERLAEIERRYKAAQFGRRPLTVTSSAFGKSTTGFGKSSTSFGKRSTR
jgi:hypothetical protein